MADECSGCKELRPKFQQLQSQQDDIGNFLWPPNAGETLREFIQRQSTEAKDDRQKQDIKLEKLSGEITNLKSRNTLIITLVSIGLGILTVVLKFIGN